MAIRLFPDLYVRGDADSVRQWREAVAAALPDDWRSVEVRMGELHGRYYCFARSATEGRPEARLFLMEEPQGLWVANIVPIGRNLNAEEYNAVLRDFRERLAQPAAGQAGVEVAVSSDTDTLEDAFPSGVLGKLRRFSDSANKSTMPDHPLDVVGWLGFLVAAHHCEANIGEGRLRRLLWEELGWPEDMAAELAREYRSGLDLLRFYDRTGQLPP